MTRWLHCVTSLGLSKLLKGLMGLVALKLAIFLVLAVNISSLPETSDTASLETHPVSGVALGGTVFSLSSASAQDTSETEDEAMAEGEDTSSEPGSLERETLLRKQEELDRREQALSALEDEIDAKLVRLQELEASISRMLEEAREVMDEKLKHLIDVYSNMKPKQAAEVIETLDEDIAVKILAGMPGRVAGEILSNVQAEKAAQLTEMLTNIQVPY